MVNPPSLTERDFSRMAQIVYYADLSGHSFLSRHGEEDGSEVGGGLSGEEVSNFAGNVSSEVQD